MDNTAQKIIDATMSLIRDKGYVATTTKDIANLANVNECTLFRKFKHKKEIVLSGMAQEKWRANISPAVFQNVVWDLHTDLKMFMKEYLDRITPDFVRLSIGLRAPQIYEETAPMIMKIPEVFLSSLLAYFTQMQIKGNIPSRDYESLAMTIFSSTFGYVFLSASFDQKLSHIKRDEFIENSVCLFVKGIL